MNSPGRGRGTQSSCRKGNSWASCSSNQLWTTHFGGRDTRQSRGWWRLVGSSFKVWKHVKMFWFQFQTLLHALSFWLQEKLPSQSCCSSAMLVVENILLCRAANCRRKPFGMDLQPLGLQAPTAVIPLWQSLWSRRSSTLTRRIPNGAVLHGTLSTIFGIENNYQRFLSSCGCCAVWQLLCFFSIWANDRLSSNIQSARLLPGSRFSLWHGGPLWMCFLSILVFPRHLAFGFF